MSIAGFLMSIAILGILTVMFAAQGLFVRAETRAAKKFIESFKGDKLPAPATLRDKGFSATFLGELMLAYIDEDTRLKEGSKGSLSRDALLTAHNVRVGGVTKVLNLLDWREEPDCPECANGVNHTDCRTGWRESLQAGWVPPCKTCGGNCGQCSESHCGICGVKPRDGECDETKHLLYERKFPEVKRMR